MDFSKSLLIRFRSQCNTGFYFALAIGSVYELATLHTHFSQEITTLEPTTYDLR